MDGTIHLPDTRGHLDLFQMTPVFLENAPAGRPPPGWAAPAGHHHLFSDSCSSRTAPEGAPVLHRKAAHRAVLIGRRGVWFHLRRLTRASPVFPTPELPQYQRQGEEKGRPLSAMGAASSAPLKPKAWDNSSARGISTTATCRTKGMARACTQSPNPPGKRRRVAM